MEPEVIKAWGIVICGIIVTVTVCATWLIWLWREMRPTKQEPLVEWWPPTDEDEVWRDKWVSRL